MRKTWRYLAVAASTSVLAGPLAAQTVTQSAGTQHTTPALSGFQTFADDMAGMLVTGFDGSGTAFSGNWSLDGGVWGVTTSLFSLTLNPNGDTFNAPWTLAATGGDLFSLMLNGAPGNTVFDRTLPSTGSPGSEGGRDLFFTTADMWNTLVTYSNQVAVGGTVYGDIYEQVTLDFDTRFTNGTSVQFVMDADNAAVAGTIIPDPTVAPEPISVILLGTGLVGVGVVTRRRRRLEA